MLEIKPCGGLITLIILRERLNTRLQSLVRTADMTVLEAAAAGARTCRNGEGPGNGGVLCCMESGQAGGRLTAAARAGPHCRQIERARFIYGTGHSDESGSDVRAGMGGHGSLYRWQGRFGRGRRAWGVVRGVQ